MYLRAHAPIKGGELPSDRGRVKIAAESGKEAIKDVSFVSFVRCNAA